MTTRSGARSVADGEAGTGVRVACPVCTREFAASDVEEHVNRCLFLSTPSPSSQGLSGPLTSPSGSKRPASMFIGAADKKHKVNSSSELIIKADGIKKSGEVKGKDADLWKIPLAELMRPDTLEAYVGQQHVLGERQMLRELLDHGEVPSMILWGPPGCGKTSLAHVVATMCRARHDMRFVKLSATTAGIADVKEVVAHAKNELKYNRRTILFMDEIHRFNKLQQDAFLPHVESGAVVLLGATTENPSFSLNNALLSRCRVVTLRPLRSEEVVALLERALRRPELGARVVTPGEDVTHCGDVPRVLVERDCLPWLADTCDGDARIALGGLQLALQALDPPDRFATAGPALLTLEHVKEGVKRSHTLYSRKGDEHYDMVSALHKSVRASHDSAALYWLTRMRHGGEDPLYIARRLVRAASEDIGLAAPTALPLAVACMQGCQLLGAPECDVLLAQCAVSLARAPKSQEVYRAMLRAQRCVAEQRGPLPPVPLHLRNAPTKLMKQMGCGKGYNMRHMDESGLQYMPEGLEDVDFFVDS